MGCTSSTRLSLYYCITHEITWELGCRLNNCRCTQGSRVIKQKAWESIRTWQDTHAPMEVKSLASHTGLQDAFFTPNILLQWPISDCTLHMEGTHNLMPSDKRSPSVHHCHHPQVTTIQSQTSAYPSTHTVYQYKIHFFHYFGGIWPYWKMDTGKHNFMRFCCRFKLSKKVEKLSNEQPMKAITKCTLAGLVQYAKKSHQKWDLKLCMHI